LLDVGGLQYLSGVQLHPDSLAFEARHPFLVQLIPQAHEQLEGEEVAPDSIELTVLVMVSDCQLKVLLDGLLVGVELEGQGAVGCAADCEVAQLLVGLEQAVRGQQVGIYQFAIIEVHLLERAGAPK